MLDPTTLPQPLHPHLPHMVILTQPGCSPCRALLRRADGKEVPHIAVDITADDRARAIIDDLGAMATPTTIYYPGGDGEAVVGVEFDGHMASLRTFADHADTSTSTLYRRMIDYHDDYLEAFLTGGGEPFFYSDNEGHFS